MSYWATSRLRTSLIFTVAMNNSSRSTSSGASIHTITGGTVGVGVAVGIGVGGGGGSTSSGRHSRRSKMIRSIIRNRMMPIII